ncbi:toxin glutamine deamidase domain-containing protein [Mycobacterium sp. TY815]|uniref:toxin glutamine deamidase domain-containing protein n=1 Tax=Mycobacterium sp. TY815 TaxID=3050581 RepID=UPI000FBF5E74|nr:toxin glutamine deamidase domain-containing protein [Mycobacterium sp. TY815]MDP7705238.1 toxin glutamine deamidase domain-containing protein [Mycobacterium sp. TY815]RUP02450.1 MAG: DUF4237 domain-containing protein [Mycobacterium sp.]
MGIELPGWLRWVGDMIGEPFPEGDETACRRQRDRWRHFAEQLEGLKDELDSATQTTLSGFTSGEIHNKLDERLRPFASSVDQIAGQLRQLADAVDGVATEIEFAKEMFIANLVALAAAVTALIATAWINWTAPAEIAGAVALAEAAISQVIRAAVSKVASEAVARVIAQVALRALEGAAANALMSGALNAGIQGQQALQGNRHEFDSRSFWDDVESGAISGAVMGPILKGAHDFDAGSALGNRAKNFGASFVGNAGGALAAQQAMTGHLNLGDALGAGAVFGAVDGVRSPGGHAGGGPETTALAGDRTGSLTVEPLPAEQHSQTPPVDAGPTVAGRSPGDVATPAGNVDVPLNLESRGHDVATMAPVGIAGPDTATTPHTSAPPTGSHPSVTDAAGSPPSAASPVANAPAAAHTGAPPASHASPSSGTPHVPSARAGVADAAASAAGADAMRASPGTEPSTHPMRDAESVPREGVPPRDPPPRDIPPPRDVPPSRDLLTSPRDPAPPPHDAPPPREVQPARDTRRDGIPQREDQPARDGQPSRDAAPARDAQSPRDAQPSRDGTGRTDRHPETERAGATEATDRARPTGHDGRPGRHPHAERAGHPEASSTHRKDTAGHDDSQQRSNPDTAHDTDAAPLGVISPVSPQPAHGAEKTGGQHASLREPAGSRRDPDDPSGAAHAQDHGPTDATGFDNPANHRIYGPHELRPVEDPAHQAAVRQACEDPAGGYTTWADPRTNPYGSLVNDGGPSVPGRRNNCTDCALAALASFYGHPTVSAPRFLDRLPGGRIDSASGEASGFSRAKAWLGEGLRPADLKLSVPERFDALHQQIKQMGPGASALVINEWHAMDANGRPMFNRYGAPITDGAHATVIVYPRDAAGPVWWDPQRSLTSDHPPSWLVDDSASLWFTPVAPDHFGPIPPQQGAHHGGTGHPAASTGLPGADLPREHFPGGPVRDGLGGFADPAAGEPHRTGSGFDETRDRFADRSRHGISELVDQHGGRGLPGSQPHRPPTDGGPDLSVPVEDRHPAPAGGPRDHHVSDDRGVSERPARTHPGTPADHQQTHAPERAPGHPVERGDVARGVDEPAEPRGLARGDHDGVLTDGSVPHEPADAADDIEAGDRGRYVASHADTAHAAEIANQALWNRIPPVHPSEIQHHPTDNVFGDQRARDNATWWRELSGEEQRALVDAYPREIGNAEGIPAWARTAASEHELTRLQHRLQARMESGEHLSRSEKAELKRYNEIRRALDEAREQAGRLGGEVHILAFDPHAFHGDGRMVVSVGHDPYRAESVSWHVPGLGNDIGKLAGNLRNALNHLDSIQAAKPGSKASSIAWIGYDAPSGRASFRVMFPGLAREGGAILQNDISAFNAARDGGGGSHFADNHVFGHSYGSTTTSHAGHGGRMADDVRTVTLLGSPGAGPLRHASAFGIGDNVFVASSSRDPVTMLGGRTAGSAGRFFGIGLGMDPAMRGFGAHRINAEFPRHMDDLVGTAATHSAYYAFDPRSGVRSESLANFGRIAAGESDQVHTEAHRFVDDRPRVIPGWRTHEPAMSRPLEHDTGDLDSLRRQFWDPHWLSGTPDPVHSAEPSGPGWHRVADTDNIDPHYGEPLPRHWDYPGNPVDPGQTTPAVASLIADPTAPFGRDQDGNAYTQAEYAERFNTLGPNGQEWNNFPGNDGAVPGTRIRYTDIDQFFADYGRHFDRIGGEDGKYLGLAPNGERASWEERALHVKSLRDPLFDYTLEYLPPGWEIEISEIAPGLGQPGGGLQVLIFDSNGRVQKVQTLTNPAAGLLKRGWL